MLGQFTKQLLEQNKLFIKVKVQPNSAKTEVKKVLDDRTVEVNVAAQPVKGKANQELIKFLAKEFKINKNNVTIIKGKQQANKLVQII